MTVASPSLRPPSRAEALRGDEATLFETHHEDLLRSVGRAVNASDALIEDACSFAWCQLLRRQPDRGPQLFGWLRTVAIRQAYRLSRVERRDKHLEELARAPLASTDGWQGLLPDPVGLDDRLRARRALGALASLPERQRRYMALFIAGYSYREITRLTGATHTNVNKHLTRARARLRETPA